MSASTDEQPMQQARRAAARGDWRSVAALCVAALKAEPQLAAAHALLGLAAMEGGKPDMALRALRTALRCDSGCAEARVYLARLYAASGQFAAAEGEAAQCRDKIADDPALLDQLATVYSRIGRQQQALSLYQRALPLAPDDVRLLANTAAVQLFLGQSDEARDNLLCALAREPAHYRSHWLLAKSRYTSDGAHLQTLESIADDAPQAEKPYVHYAAGKLCEDLSDWHGAWRHYSAGAAAQRQRVRYNPQQDRALFRALAENFSDQWYHAGESSPEKTDDERPIFVVGLPRAGSTLVEQILASHSSVQGLGELIQWPLAVKQEVGSRESDLYSTQIAEASAKRSPEGIARRYLASIRHLRKDRTCFTDKLPANFLYLPLIAQALPRARFVHVVRDPMDACFAIYKQLFADAYPWSYDLEELGQYYVEYHRLMQKWQALLGERLYTVEYDTLVREPETQIRALLEGLQLPFEPGCLEFHRGNTAAATASATQVREPIHARSSGRWRQFSEQLQPLRAILADADIYPEN